MNEQQGQQESQVEESMSQAETAQAKDQTQEQAQGGAQDNAQNASGSDAGGDKAEEKQEPPRPRQPTYIETLERRLQETQEQLREYIGAYKQIKEDQEALRKRLEREAAREQEIMRGRLVNELLEVLDNVDRSVLGAESGWSGEAMLGGLRMVQGQFLEKLMGMGLKLIDPAGKSFNPNDADALDVTITTDEALDNTVSRVYTRGYRLGERVIRPARVQVARFQKSDGNA